MSEQSVKESRGSYLADAAKELVATASESSFDATTFFEKFELLAETSDSIAMLRELLLQLAFQGKLTESRREDLKDWNAICESVTANVDNQYTALKFTIPDHWCWTTLERIGDTKPRNKIADELEVGFAPMATIPISFRDSIAFERRAWGEIKKGFTHFQEKDVVVAKITPCFQNGKSAVIRQCPNGFGAGTTELHVFRPILDIVHPEFVLLYTKSPWFLKRGVPRMTGSAGQKRVPHSYFAESPLPLPPLAEQKRIVAKVDELMGLCDRLEALEAERKERHASLSRAALARFAAAPTPTNLQLLFHNSFDVEPGDIRQSILALAIRGKLVSQQSEDKPLEPEVTLDRQQAFDIPTNWVWTNLKGIGTCHTGKTPPTNNPLNYGTGFPFIGPGQITPTGKLITSEKMLTKAGLENTTIGNPGDILMVCIGGSIGKAVACQETIGFNQQINSIRVSKSLPEFILLVLVSSYFQNEVVSRASGSATPIINKGKWEQIPIPIPPLAEQKRIVAKVDELMALVDQLEQQLANSRTLGQQLLEAVVEHLTNSKAQTEAIT